MEQERKRARQMGYSDPINDSYEATTAMYFSNLEYCLEAMKRSKRMESNGVISGGGRISVMVASHNEMTVRYAVEKMGERGIKADDGCVFFGQLLGMCDYITFYLGGRGFTVYKVVPYGPVDEVLPYLSRRANENRGIFDKVKKEKRLIWTELKRRAFGN
jgi:proline dehydrogenase